MDNALMRYGTQAPQGGQNALMRTNEMERQRILQELIARGPDPEEMGPHPYIMTEQERANAQNSASYAPSLGLVGGIGALLGGGGLASAGQAMMAVPHPASKALGALTYGVGRGAQWIGAPAAAFGGDAEGKASQARIEHDNAMRERLLRQNGY